MTARAVSRPILLGVQPTGLRAGSVRRSEEAIEGCIEGGSAGLVLDQSARQCLAQPCALKIDEADRLHGVERFRDGDREPRIA